MDAKKKEKFEKKAKEAKDNTMLKRKNYWQRGQRLLLPRKMLRNRLKEKENRPMTRKKKRRKKPNDYIDN